ncbi:MAG: D-aminoacylase [Acidobacteriota bacterium]|nr:D-aminoacylase [Acidobacteriota bacterium]
MSRLLTRREFLKTSSKTAIGWAGGGILLQGCDSRKPFDLLIRSGRVFDGTGAEEIIADIGIRGDRIVKIGGIASSRAKSIIDAKGLVVCPGFIDAHDHTDVELLVNPRAESHLRQGITTVVSGNCGGSVFPLSDETYRQRRRRLMKQYGLELDWRDIRGFFGRLKHSRSALNFSTFVGHGSIRRAVMGSDDRPPRAEELSAMKIMVEENLRDGALGISSGLAYAPGSFAQPYEIIELCRVAVKNGGMYASHLRSEDDSLLEALDETIDVAEQTGIRIQISHLKTAYPRNWPKIDDVFTRLEKAAASGIKVFCDRYPYVAGETGLSNFNFPLWACEGTTEEFLARLKDPALERRFREYLRFREEKLGSWDKVLISSIKAEQNRRFEGVSVAAASRIAGKDVFAFLRDLLIEENNQAGQIIFMGSEENLRRILAHPLVGIGCDGSAQAPYGPLGHGKSHPRSYGTFPRVLGRYVRDEEICPLREMIRKITRVPAANFGFAGRGVLKPGAFADIVIFDEYRVADRATWTEPQRYPDGIDHVIVNGVPVINNGEHSGALPGRILNRSPV